MEKSDEALVTEYLSGNEGAFARLLERHLKSVYSLALRSAGDEAEDIAQDAFLKAWKNLERYDPRSAKFKTWLMRIARNTVIDYLRKRKAFVFSDIENDGESAFDAPDPGPLPDELAARAHDARAIEEALEKLPLPYREVLLLRYMEQMTFEEIAAVLEESPNTVRSRHRRGLAKLREELGDVHQKGT